MTVQAPLTTPPTRGSGPAAVLVLVAGVAAVLAMAGAGVYFLSEYVSQHQSDAGPLGGPDVGPNGEVAPPKVPLISSVGFDTFRDDLRKETGSADVVGLTVYPLYAVAEVLTDPAKGRTKSLYYDGAFSDSGLGTTTDRPFDVAQVDADAMVTLSHKARKMVDQPNQWYLIMHAPDAEGAVVYAYASNAYGEGAYISATADGKVVRRVTW